MEIMIYLILPVVGSFFLLGSMVYGAYRIAGRPRVLRRSWGIVIAFAILNVAGAVFANTWINLFFMLLFPFVMWWVFRTPKIYLVPYFILSTAVFLTDVVVVTCFQFLLANGTLYLNSQELIYILLVVSDRFLIFMVIMLITVATGKTLGRHITVRQVALSILLPVFSLFNMYTTLFLMQVYLTKTSLFLFMVNLSLLIALNVYFCVLIEIMSENHRLENERNLYRQQAQMQYHYYEREEEKYEESRKLIHDIRNHIQAMEDLYRKEGAQDAARYADNIHQMLNSFQQKYYTSEKLLNIILNDKVQLMRAAGIREDIKVGELSLDFMKDVDVTTLFANLLDNAVAAASGSCDRYIRLRVNLVRQFLSIIMENSCDREPVKVGEGFRSCKSGHEGMGIKNIRRTVEQYGGDVQFEWKDGVFTTKVMLAAVKE